MQKLAFNLGQIRLHVEAAREELEALEAVVNPRYSKWKCDGCGYEKHFTKASTVMACDSCPRCHGTALSPIVK